MIFFLKKSAIKSYGLKKEDLKNNRFKLYVHLSNAINLRRNANIKPSELYIFSIFPSIYEKIIKFFEKREDINLNIELNKILNEFPNDQKQKFLDEINKEFKYKNLNFAYFLITIKLLNENPAFRIISDLISDEYLKKNTIYLKVNAAFEKHLSKIKPKYFKNKSLTEFLRIPFINSPDNIYKQLVFIVNNWKELLGSEYDFLLKAIDYYKEDTKFGLPIPGPSSIYSFDDLEPERFTEDKDWMPHLVLIAKSTYVWLYQLSKKYKREVKHLNQIPDEELSLLSKRGFTGLWLIGIWERSKASKKIKRLTGQTDAIASAYSLDDYVIATDLGGEDAYNDLKNRALRYNIKLACDMVPNHTGLDSKWIVEHPDYFMQLDYSPYPNYTFNGENLSAKPDIKVYIEDHYYDKTDAAVVFKLIDKNGQTRYIYHGNDGTSFPWNDTAQLDYTRQVVRQAVSDKIIEVAKKFPIIRFDAAMTLAKKHFQRLWFPEPGSGGAIPSRAQFGLSKEEFNKLMPKEFWREVVDRVNKEAPDTLLLAEAFWMMEGYFVRTLGMHRVYNSAFMNMLKNEENEKYRQSIFNILEFNPQILKRFVNFMSNPDEETAINQFGDNDKYFGVCVLMATMPGLPMFAHGQIEGFKERYGMEFYRPALNEKENINLINRHNREIFPLLKLRRLFSDVTNFYLYNFETDNNIIDHNVFAYSNEYQSKITLVVYHNKFAETQGKIRFADYPLKKDNKTKWEKINIAKNLHLSGKENHFLIYKNLINGLEYIRNSKEIREYGLFFHLKAYQYMVFANFREVEDTQEKEYEKIAKYLQGGGTENLEHLKNKIAFLPIIDAFNTVLQQYNLETFIKLTNISTGEYKFFLYNYLKEQIIAFEKNLNLSFYKKILNDLEIAVKSKIDLPFNSDIYLIKKLLFILIVIKYYKNELLEKYYLWEELQNITGEYFDLIKGINGLINKKITTEKELFENIFENKQLCNYLKVNTYNGEKWFYKEGFEILIDILYFYFTIFKVVLDWDKIMFSYKKCGFKVESFLKGL